MKKIVRIIFKILLLTIALPFTLAMALGYWSSGEDTFYQSFKEVIK